MGIPDLLNFVSREFPHCVTRLPTPQELQIQQQRAAAAAKNTNDAHKNTQNQFNKAQHQKPTFNYALLDMSNILQTIGVQAAFDLLTQQATITHAIFLVADGNRQRAGARRERLLKMFRADKDVDTAIAQLSGRLKAFFEQQQQQQQQQVVTGHEQQPAATAAARVRGRDESGIASSSSGSSSSSTSPVVIVNIGSENYGEGDFKLLHLHRHLTLSAAAAAAATTSTTTTTTSTTSSPSASTPLFISINSTTGRPDGHIGSPNPPSPTFLFISEDSDLFCGALCGPSPKNVFIATTFHDLMTSLCMLSVGDCAEALAKKAGIDVNDAELSMTPTERNKCIQFVALDVITLFTILLGNGQCPPLAKGATRVDSRAVWTAYCNVRWPNNNNNNSNNNTSGTYDMQNGHDADDAFGYYNDNYNNKSNQDKGDYYGHYNNAAKSISSTAHNSNNNANKARSDEERFGNFLMEVQDPKKTHQGPSSSLVLNCELLAKVLGHFHCTDLLAHAPAAEQRKLAREYLIAVARSAFRYCAGTTIDSREEAQPQVPSLASLSYVADDSILRFYPFTTTFGFGMNNNTAAVAGSGGGASSSSSASGNGAGAGNTSFRGTGHRSSSAMTTISDASSPSSSSASFTMNAIVPGLRNASTSSSSSASSGIVVAFSKPAVKSKEHKYTFGELTKMFTTIVGTNSACAPSSTSATSANAKSSVQTPATATAPVVNKFSFELRRMIPVSTTTIPSVMPAAPTATTTSSRRENQLQKRNKNKNKKQEDQEQQQQQQQGDANNAENGDEDFSYFDAHIMDEQERKEQKIKDKEMKKKKLSKKQKVKEAEKEADILQRKKDRNKKKNRKRKDKKAAAKGPGSEGNY